LRKRKPAKHEKALSPKSVALENNKPGDITNPVTGRTYTHCYGSAPITSREMKGIVTEGNRDQTGLALSDRDREASINAFRKITGRTEGR
jgi:hypothetical protein